MNAGTATATGSRTEGHGPAHHAMGTCAAAPAAAPTVGATHHEPTLARTTAQLLHACAAAAGGAGLLCAAGAMLGLLMPAPGTAALLCALVLALLPLERLLGLRVRFDAGLFTDLAHALDRNDDALAAGAARCAAMPAGAAIPACAALDAALHALNLRDPAAAPRPLIDRAQGARRLALQHALAALAQFALLMSALALRLSA